MTQLVQQFFLMGSSDTGRIPGIVGRKSLIFVIDLTDSQVFDVEINEKMI